MGLDFSQRPITLRVNAQIKYDTWREALSQAPHIATELPAFCRNKIGLEMIGLFAVSVAKLTANWLGRVRATYQLSAHIIHYDRGSFY